jgi:hypothetical protein
MFLFFKRINIFLLSLLFIFAPITNYAYAIDPIIPPFTSAPAAADIAAALGASETGGFAAGAATGLAAAAAIGVGVGSFCIASAVQGANMCGVSTPICKALTGAMINCTPNPDGSFSKPAQPVPTTNADNTFCNQYPYGYASNWANPRDCTPKTYTPYSLPQGQAWSCGVPTWGQNDTPTCIVIAAPQAPPKIPDIKVPPEDVGKAIAGNPAAAAAVGAAAAAAAGVGASANSSNCSGSMGTFNGVSTCVPALGASNNPSCTGYQGVVNGQSVCVPALGAGSISACSGYSGTVNGVTTCIPEIGSNPACSGSFGTFNGTPICIGGSTPDYNPTKATADAIAAAQAAANNPPTNRACASNMQLQQSGICVNPALPNPNNSACNRGYVFNGSTCIPADPLNPTLPATTTPLTPAQAAANAAAAAASTSLTQARANAQATAADAAAHPTDQTKAAAAAAAAAALQQATLDAVAANTAATAEATAQPKPAELPAFCGWAAIVCDFANVGISAIKWAKTDAQAPTDTNVNVKSDTPTELQNFDMHKSYFNFGSQCPADVPMTFTIMGKTTTLNFQYTAICDFLGKIRPFVIGSAWIAGAFIVTGSSRKGGDD